MAEHGRTDPEIVAAALGDPNEFRVLFRRHYDAVYRFCARRIGVGEAEDVTATTFLTAYRILDRFDQSRDSALPWLLGIASNTIGDAMRKRRRRDRIVVAVAPDLPTMPEDDDVVDRTDAEHLGLEINRALSRLPKRDTDAFLLYALGDLSYSEVAEALGVPAGTVASRINRVRGKVREAMSDIEQTKVQKEPYFEGDRDA